MDEIEIGDEVVFNAPDGYTDRARFIRKDGDLYRLGHRSGLMLVSPADIVAVVRPKPVVYSEVPIPSAH